MFKAPGNMKLAATKRGYIIKSKFHEYGLHFVKFLKSHGLMDKTNLLIIDGHKSHLYVTAAGCGLVIPVLTFVLTGDIHQSGYASGRYGNSVQDGYRILFTWGGYALTSPKGGRPCSLSTFNHVVAGHLAYQ